MDFINYSMILNLIPGRVAYRNFVLDGIRKEIANPFKNIQYQSILGDSEFTSQIKEKYINEGSIRDQPAYREILYDKVKPNMVFELVSRTYNIPVNILSKKRTDGNIRGIIAELLYRYCGLNNREIGQILGGIDYGGVHQLRRRLKRRIKENVDFKKQYEHVMSDINELCSK
jgi:chromosomal replication initiation ATPase DnaA